MAKKKPTRDELLLRIRTLEVELAQVRRDNAAWESLAKVLDGSLRNVRDKLQRVYSAIPGYSTALKALVNETGLDLGTAISTLACSRPDKRKLLFSLLCSPVMSTFCRQALKAMENLQLRAIIKRMEEQTKQP
jgi:hypothetical protein